MRWSSAVYHAFFSATVSSAWRAGPSTETLDSRLFQRAAAVRDNIFTPLPSPDAVAYPSAYAKPDGSGEMRGFCNWLIPQRLMVGQYPGQNPEKHGPTSDEVFQHIQSIVQDAGVSFFCSLQSEIPSQDDNDAWERNGSQVYLQPSLRNEFPRPFSHYAPIVRSVLNNDNKKEPTFLHAPIEDLSVPNSQPLQQLLIQLLQAMEKQNTIYLHCWGGRGRAGLVGACLVSLIYPELEPQAVLDLVQSGYESRAGADAMPPLLSRSPQTLAQRQFVHEFVLEQQRQRAKMKFQ